MIAIPNMEKPKSCGLCQLCLNDSRIANGYCMFFHRTVNTMELDKDCPLIEIPDEIWEALKPKVDTMSMALTGWVEDALKVLNSSEIPNS